MKKIFLILLFITIFPIVNAVICYDTFNSNVDVIEVCGYCSELNGSICGLRQCNITIYYSNFSSFVENVSVVNNGEGNLLYNITQDLGSGLKNLSDGRYFGEFYCGPRSREDFSFIVSTSTATVYTSGYSGRIAGVDEDEEVIFIKRTIPEDIEHYINYFAQKVSPSNIAIGKCFFWFLLILLLFSQEIYKIIKKVRLKKKF